MQVKVQWSPNAAEEMVTGYNVYVDDAPAGATTLATELVIDLAPAAHKIEVAAVNMWGEGPKSDPITTPASAPSKPMGVSVTVTVNVVINP